MAIVRADQYNGMGNSESGDIVPFTEYCGEQVLAMAAQGGEYSLGNVVPAGEYMQNDPEAPAPQAKFAPKFARETPVQRVIEDTPDIYEDYTGFLQTDYAPDAVVAFYDKDGNPTFAE